ncbi:MAG: hypothetical protein IPM81_04470 [Saprospirales bacterium]|nr:hypothetical protein [Saprospirales bacterium]
MHKPFDVVQRKTYIPGIETSTLLFGNTASEKTAGPGPASSVHLPGYPAPATDSVAWSPHSAAGPAATGIRGGKK